MKTENIKLNGRAECEIRYFTVLDSTNTYIKRLAEENAPSWTVVIADGQSSGYGRYGRSFDSKSDSGLYMSVLLRTDIPFDTASLTPTAAVATASAIEKLCGKSVDIKWVNDLLIDGLKVCGILSEASSDGGMLKYAVIGIGVNIGGRDNGFSDELMGIAGTIMDEYSEEIRDRLAINILCELEKLIYSQDDTVYSEYRRRLAYVSEKVRVIKHEGEYEATVLGLSPDFKLVVRSDDGSTERLFSGEIRIKAK